MKPLTNLSHLFKVFPCVSATCGHFYHPKCVSKLLHPSDVTKAEELCSKIAEGDSFTCPVHKCFECKQVEDKKVYELQFAICRRCPKAYHRKCLPRFPNLIFLFEVSIMLFVNLPRRLQFQIMVTFSLWKYSCQDYNV